MTGVAMVSLMVGMTGMMVESRTFMLTAAAGMAAAAVISGVTVVILQVTGRRRPRWGRHDGFAC